MTYYTYYLHYLGEGVSPSKAYKYETTLEDPFEAFLFGYRAIDPEPQNLPAREDVTITKVGHPFTVWTISDHPNGSDPELYLLVRFD